MIRNSLFIILVTISATALGQTGCIEGGPTLAYWKFDNPKQRETIIVLHGGPAATHQYLRPEFDSLFRMGTVIYYDQRGCGRSAHAENYHWKEHVQDLKRVIQAVSKNKKVILVSSSWGSMLALLYSMTYPNDLKGIILSGNVSWMGENRDSVLSTKEYDRTKWNANPTIMPRIHREKKVRTIQIPGGNMTTDTILIEKYIPITEGLPMVESLLSVRTAPSFNELNKIKIPVLLLTGSQNQCKEIAEAYASILPNSELFATPDGCHDPWINNPEIFFKKCEEFIRRLPGNLRPGR